MISEVFNEDCQIGMGRYPDGFFDLAIVDPPYGVGNFSQTNKLNRPHSRSWEINWNEEIPTREYFDELFRVSKNFIIWGANYYKEFVTTRGTIVWDKGNNSPVGSQAELATTNLFERVVIYYEKWTGFINSEGISGKQKIHPCQKPIDLYRWQLQEYSKEGYKILDTHMGSQSSRIAAHLMGFDYWGWELDKDYFNAGNKRFKEQTAQQQLFTHP